MSYSSGYIITHINYGWRTVTEDYFLTCCKCSKDVRRTATDGCNGSADADYIKTLVERLKTRAEQYSKQTDFVCNKCLAASSDMTLDFSENVSINPVVKKTLILEEIITNSLKDQNTHLRDLETQYKKRIVKHKNQLWIIDYLGSNSRWGGDVQINAYLTKLHAKRPWETTNISETVSLTDLEVSDKFLKDIQPKV